jgi:hypothetical protein
LGVGWGCGCGKNHNTYISNHQSRIRECLFFFLPNDCVNLRVLYVQSC